MTPISNPFQTILYKLVKLTRNPFDLINFILHKKLESIFNSSYNISKKKKKTTYYKKKINIFGF